MDRVCPRCRGTTPELVCPRCGVRTDTAASTAGGGGPSMSAGGWLVGLLVAQGLYYALRHLVSAGLIARAGESAEVGYWDDLGGLLTEQALQAPALFIGGMLAGAGRRRGLWIGAALGLVNALFLLGLPVLLHRSTDPLVWYVQPVLNAFVGAIGGAVGSRVWQPPPELPPLTGDGRGAQKILTTILPDRATEIIHDPTPWLRIFAGVGVAVGGTIGARLIRDAVVVAGGGHGREMEQSIFITWEITLIAQVIGGGIAGADRRMGAVNGFWVGLPAAMILVMIQAMAAGRVLLPAVPAWLIGGNVADSPNAVLVQGLQALFLGVLGGWLGSLILPADPGNRLTNPP